MRNSDIHAKQSFASLIPFFYFAIMGFRSSSRANQLVNLISALILLAIPVCLTKNHHNIFDTPDLLQLDIRNEWFYHLVFSLPILALAILLDHKFIGKRLIRQYFAIAAFTLLAIAANKIYELSYTTCLLSMPGIFCLFAGNRKQSNLPKTIFYTSALVFLPIACCNYINILENSNYSLDAMSWLNTIYVLFAMSLAIIPDCNALGKRIHREHFATVLLLILSTITLFQQFTHPEFHHLTELIPVAGALTLTIHESIWFNRHNSRYMTPISATILYIISTAILFDIANHFNNLTHYPLALSFMFPVIATLAIIPLCIEHFTSFNSQYRPYQYLPLTGYSIPAIATICTFFSNDLVYPTATALMLLFTGLIGSWCINHREQHRYGIVLASTTYFGLYLLFSTFYIDDTLFGLPTYFNFIFTSFILAAIAFYDGRKFKGYTPLRAIWALSAIPLLAVHYDTWHIAHTAGIVIIAANLLQYLTDGCHSDRDRIIITITVSIITIGCVIKICKLSHNFAGISVDLRPILATLIPIAAAYLVSRFTWNFRSSSHAISFGIASLSSFILFYFPDNDILLYDVVITILALTSIAISVAHKYKRYLAYGCAFILMIFFSQTKYFWLDLHWWIYLAIVAAILIFFAVTNEILIRQGSSILKKLQASQINHWRW